MLISLSGCAKNQNSVSPVDSTKIPVTMPLPKLSGKLLFHRYDQYGDAANIYLYNFDSDELSCLSTNWNIFNPINALFNAQGTQIVFMGESIQSGKWDIYLWTLGSSNPPINLTALDGSRDEDAHFSPDGTHICFKQTTANGVGNIKIMDLQGVITQVVTTNTIESSMPCFTQDATALIYARGNGSTSDIYMVNVNGSNNHSLANTVDVQEYYPIVSGASTFFYTRWYSSGNPHDQIYLGNFTNHTNTILPFNTSTADYSDPFPCTPDLVVMSCDRKNGAGAYDLCIASLSTGQIWSLSEYNAQINGAINELGACYSK